MSLSTEERAALREAARSLLERRSPLEKVRELMETEPGYDPGLWREMAGLGWLELLVPGPDGFEATGFAEAAILLEELGRLVTPSPFLSSAVLATTAIARQGDAGVRERWLPALAAGRAIGTIALTGPSGRAAADLVAVAASEAGGVWRVDGEAGFVPNAEIADFVVVAAGAPEPALFLVDTGPSVRAERRLVFDRTRRLYHVRFNAALATVLARGEAAAAAREELLALAAAGLAADAAGGAGRVTEISVEYAKVRVQFDRPIGSFQAIKHRLADMHVLSLASAAAAEGAAAAIEAGESARLAVAATASFALDAYARVAGDAIQVHGGIGYTWEHDCHLYFKRAQLDAALLGDPTRHRAALAAGVLAGTPLRAGAA